MLIHVDQPVYGFRYLPADHSKSVSLFFSCNNVAYRRETLQKIGGFDTDFGYCEDVDLGLRLGNEGAFFSNPRAQVWHESSFTRGRFFSQWKQIAVYQTRLLKKHSAGNFEIFRRSSWEKPREFFFRMSYYRKTQGTYVLFLSPFLAWQASLWTLLLIGPWLPAGGGTVLTWASLACAVRYFSRDFRRARLSLMKRARFAALRAAVNFTVFYGSLVEGLRLRMLYLPYER